jgi:hypothetical protein
MFKRLLSIAAIFALTAVAHAGPANLTNVEIDERVSLTGTATLTAVHGIPGLPEPVDVYVNEAYAFSFDFPQILGPVALDAGPTLVEVKLGDLTVLSEKVWLAPNRDYSASAHLTETGAISLSFYMNDLSPLRPGTTRLIARHNAQAPAVEIRIAASRATEWQFSIPNFANRNQAGPLDIEAGTYDIGLFVGDTEVYRANDVLLPEGASTSLFAVGVFPSSFQVLSIRSEIE